MRARLVLALSLCLLPLTSCASFAECVSRGVMHYEAERWDDALAVWTEIEADLPAQSRPDQGEYYLYLALTHLRLGHRSDARHYLAIAKQFWGVLPNDLRHRLGEAEQELARSN